MPSWDRTHLTQALLILVSAGALSGFPSVEMEVGKLGQALLILVSAGAHSDCPAVETEVGKLPHVHTSAHPSHVSLGMSGVVSFRIDLGVI